jgi:hypothetical protein
MSVAYGYDLKSGDKIIEAPVQNSKMMSRLLSPGRALVNYLPFRAVLNFVLAVLVMPHSFPSVRYIPSWVPYFSYKPLVRIGMKLSERTKNEPIDFVKNALVCGDHFPSVHLDLISRHSAMVQQRNPLHASICRS